MDNIIDRDDLVDVLDGIKYNEQKWCEYFRNIFSKTNLMLSIILLILFT